MTNFDNNYRRTLRQLAVANGWFENEEGSDRHTLHLNVTFREERLGGDIDEPVRFRVRLKRCEIVVIVLDDENSLSVDPRSVDYTKPDKPAEARRAKTKNDDFEFGGEVLVTSEKPSGKGWLKGKKAKSNSNETSDTQSINILHSLNSRSVDGHPSWMITNAYNEYLEGSLWDPHEEPRLTLIDKRSEAARTRHIETGMNPYCRIDIRCRREDLEILEITLRDPERDGFEKQRQDYKVRLRAAESFIKHQLQLEGLAVGDIHEMFSDMIVGDLIVPLDK